MYKKARPGIKGSEDSPYHMAEWICTKCGYIYNELFGDTAHNIPKNTPFEKIDSSWICPRCGARKEFFVKKA